MDGSGSSRRALGSGRRLRRASAVAAAIAVLSLVAACSDGSDSGGSGATESPGSTPAGATTTTDPGAGGSFSLLSYNVAGLPQEISKENPKEHLPLISPLLNEYDLVLTQEDFDWWRPDGLAADLDFVHYHERLRADATHRYRSPRHPGPEAAGVDLATRTGFEIGDGQGLLSRLPLDGYQRRAWTDCFGGFDTSDGGAADCLAIKGFMVATMTLPSGGKVDVYTLHVEAGGSDRDQALQGDDMDQLAAFIAEHSDGKAVIVGGDTNLHTDDEHPDGGGGLDTAIWAEFIDRVGLTDSCAALSCDQPGSIDKVAYRSGSGVELRATSWDKPQARFTDSAGADLSDHLPLVVEFDWSGG